MTVLSTMTAQCDAYRFIAFDPNKPRSLDYLVFLYCKSIRTVIKFN